MHLAAHFPGVNSTTVWADPRSGSQIDFASFEHLARTAERGKFDFFFLAEGLRLREHNGRVHDLDVVGRPESLTVLNALAAVTERLGLAATVNATFNEPYELARRLATLDHLSAGRAAWNVVTSSDAFTGENFRRGGYLDRADRYTRAAEFVATARELWDSWTPDGVSRPFAHDGPQFTVSGEFTVPRSPQGHPVVIQAGDSDEGREFAASAADVIFTRHGTLEAGRAFYADVKARLAAYGREPESLKIMPGVTVVTGDTDAEAQELAYEIRRQQVSPQNAILAAEQVWGTDLSAYDPEGPLPAFDPVPDSGITQGRVRHGDPFAIAARWRALAEAKGLSLRGTVIETTTRQSFIGSPATVAAELTAFVDGRAADGFILVPHLTPGGLDDFVDRVVPILQESGAFRSAYTGSTLRSHLGLPEPVWKG
ncbi:MULTISPECIES: NtaA/DmoA family FMN-dependent monooxygenase [Streptomyces]|uniref:F420-dependent methylene-tetrahydromethanopterin reductase n=2 Tax=Streptomyces TaxID=1883 RepID=A0A1V0U6S8_STRVN|nr:MULTISPECIES: NtaA/DmoA family FMN-dependent monooxygenase [Streptomyces]MYW78782.1 NtaA/DmoA family FMN-dependent monooxygenase [Streptomyces sp. SID8369]NEA07281.1 NtaA/DmoA family FMN-dependent monooxygenase [Streptomyces sp. SID10692]NEC43751.1 NtaA/DmoA family FMN-dependent monooxygenase [Streptomyces sp. SID8016]ARF60944.1 F420-dependent methylene-tetrahydromethanopterin reductase [Streptomyces violaceoruber]KOG77179.1 F420-dependent methylene-tetrahydromethanopterin reductase [Strept